jgi:hypothetical protein
MKLYEGMAWNHLTVVKLGVGERNVTDRDGITRTWKHAPYAECKCSCGRMVRIWLAEWRGKKHQRDCGCGVSVNDGSAVTVTATIPLGLKKQVEAYRQERGVSFSRAVYELLEKGLDKRSSVI